MKIELLLKMILIEHFSDRINLFTNWQPCLRPSRHEKRAQPALSPTTNEKGRFRGPCLSLSLGGLVLEDSQLLILLKVPCAPQSDTDVTNSSTKFGLLNSQITKLPSKGR